MMRFWIFGKKKSDHVVDELHKRTSESFSLVKKEMEKVGAWINHLDSHRKLHHGKINEIEKRLFVLEELMKGAVQTDHSNVQSFNRVQSRSVQSFMNVQSLDILSERITPKEKKVIMCLLEAGMPLEYSDIAKKLGISIVTTRRHINDIKKSGFKIEEKMNVDTKRKVFYIKNEVKNAILGKSEGSKIINIMKKSSRNWKNES
ncbi:HTH domain-containing protein [Candidatus Woesearchaeota archaeon]|nr:HTH domain-containing protein [Candidatus Woesearchaeota archaeon]